MNLLQVVVCDCVFVLSKDFVNFEVSNNIVIINVNIYNYGCKRMENNKGVQ